MCAVRYTQNPLIKVSDVKPSRPDFQVLGVFNAGAAQFHNETVLLVRVAEAPVQTDCHHLQIPILHEHTLELSIQNIPKDEQRYDFSDSRVVKENGKTILLTSISHLRVARSLDGITFHVADKPSLFPTHFLEAWGIEDPRITWINKMFFITYSAVSSKGVSVGIVTTEDFSYFDRKGFMLPPENKDVAIFPEKINGKYYTLHRPVPNTFGSPEIWLAESPDLLHWGHHQFLIGLRQGQWDGGRIGGGTVPIKTDKGWLALYHGADIHNRYCMGALLLDLQDPSIVLGRSVRPILEPETEYELNGFFGNVVFSCGAISEGNIIKMYYGAADEMMAGAVFSLEEIFATFE